MYGIYSAADANFFAGVVGSINSLRHFGYNGGIAIIDTGLDGWMRDYLQGFTAVKVLSLAPLRRWLRYTDIRSSESPVDHGWAYKAFGIAHYDLFERFTFIDADFFPMCNLEAELHPFLEQGQIVGTDDGQNIWDNRHKDAVGVMPGTYMNVNAGFLSLNLNYHRDILWEWRNLMTRRKPFDLWYGDQGAVNAVMDKYQPSRHLLNKTLWNQTHLNGQYARDHAIEMSGDFLRLRATGERIYAWHGTGPHKLWHALGIDHSRRSSPERATIHSECAVSVPGVVVDFFSRYLFSGSYNRPLHREGHLLVARD